MAAIRGTITIPVPHKIPRGTGINATKRRFTNRVTLTQEEFDLVNKMSVYLGISRANFIRFIIVEAARKLNEGSYHVTDFIE